MVFQVRDVEGQVLRNYKPAQPRQDRKVATVSGSLVCRREAGLESPAGKPSEKQNRGWVHEKKSSGG